MFSVASFCDSVVVPLHFVQILSSYVEASNGGRLTSIEEIAPNQQSNLIEVSCITGLISKPELSFQHFGESPKLTMSLPTTPIPKKLMHLRTVHPNTVGQFFQVGIRKENILDPSKLGEEVPPN